MIKDRLARARETAQKNRTLIAYGVGIVAGTTATYFAITRFGKVTAYAMATDPDLNTLLDTAKSGFLWFPGPKCNVILMSENFVKDHGHS